ncbi:hypothetical protein [Marinobacterium iners]|uniref:hypothetical protein n=1 Tax=Marinobacterium iners TaxID=48076 RepID=UPI001A8DF6D8|nr:hypothetical protein [Marinobacterium iners]
MEWAFTLEGQSEADTVIVEVPDSATPPSVGEKAVVNGQLSGIFYVKSREFQANLPSKHLGKLTFGWAFTLSPASKS